MTTLMMSKVTGLIDELKEKRIPAQGNEDRKRIMNKFFPIFTEFGNFAQGTPVNSSLQMKVWSNPTETNGFYHEYIQRTKNMCDIYEERDQTTIYGITFGCGNRTGKSSDSFVADLQIRFFSDYGTIATWHKREPHMHSDEFNRLLEMFVKRQSPPGTLRPEIKIFTEMIFPGDGTEKKVSIKQGLFFASYWKDMITPMLHQL